jgi:hypothetical protein
LPGKDYHIADLSFSVSAKASGIGKDRTLLAYLQKRRLPSSGIEVATEGIVTGFPQHDTYAKIVVSPTIRGASPAQRQEYQDAAAEARDHCFIGQTVAAGGVAYELGALSLG